MKLDMGAAWNDAVAMIKANTEVMAVIAGVFFFLPSLAAVFLVPPLEAPPGADIDVVTDILVGFYSDNALPLVLLTLTSAIGFIALLALLRDDRKPTVGDAIKTGFFGLVSYVGSQLMVALGLAVIVGVLVGIPASLGMDAIAAVAALVVAVLFVYVMIKLSMVTPVIAIERNLNPFGIVRRSWQLTKGNSLRLLLFYLLLGLAFGVISVLIGAIAGLLFALLGEGEIAEIANGAVSGLTSAAGSLVFAAILAAVHRQLAGPSTGRIAETFE
ncbi:MAG TPA: glycerophosphoryl diester phosphodiesterase membrane domain-containing protein [Sphingomonadaceae bacterium]|nr:glycerophosphoryl diester phosphodiesterase membrane domain-containing protein [Sphingomonadaceae bacterium]